MKKYSKYEKRPAGAPAKQPQVKSVLLQTYFTSLMCLVLSVTMFFGTSYAWFTNEVNNTANEIYVGTLKVGLYKDTTSLANSETKLFDKNIRWEPGYTALETITVKNEGDLAFNYVLHFTDGALKEDEIAEETEESAVTLDNVAKFFEVWVYEGTVESKSTSYEDITKEDSGWTKAGALNTLLTGKEVLRGAMTTGENNNSASATHTIALHMTEGADASVMGQTLTLNVKLIAYQKVSDSENSEKNEAAPVSNAAALKAALEGEKDSIQLLTDMTIDKAEACLTMTGGTLYGNGKTITYCGETADEIPVNVLTTSGGTIDNLKINGGENGCALYITELKSDLFVTNCVLTNVDTINAGTAHTVTFENTTINGTLTPSGDTILTNCVFSQESLNVSKLAKGKTITLTNCTYNGEWIENAVLTAQGGPTDIAKSDLLKVGLANMVKLKTNGD